MTRHEAIARLAAADCAGLSVQQRADLLLGWWCIDETNPGFAGLPPELRAELARTEEPERAGRPLFDPLLRLALGERYVGTRNGFLRASLHASGIDDRVTGEVEALLACPCCGYRTLGERGGYEVCRACFWEDDGTEEPTRPSGPNHRTLREGRENFARFGAVEERFAGHVVADPAARYLRAAEGTDEAAGK